MSQEMIGTHRQIKNDCMNMRQVVISIKAIMDKDKNYNEKSSL